jgi:hypothetical protein
MECIPDAEVERPAPILVAPNHVPLAPVRGRNVGAKSLSGDRRQSGSNHCPRSALKRGYLNFKRTHLKVIASQGRSDAVILSSGCFPLSNVLIGFAKLLRLHSP